MGLKIWVMVTMVITASIIIYKPILVGFKADSITECVCMCVCVVLCNILLLSLHDLFRLTSFIFQYFRSSTCSFMKL